MESLRNFQTKFMESLLKTDESQNPLGMAIYQNNYRYGLINALSETYPVCKRLVGKLFFEAMANQYVQSHASRFFSLNDYGSDFCDFIQHFSPTFSVPYLSDMAKMEWAIHKVFIGPDIIHKHPSKLLTIIKDPNQYNKITLSLAPNVYLLESKYPIHRIWETNQEDYQGKTEVNLDQGGDKLFIFRPKLEVQIDILEQTDWDILLKIQSKKPWVPLLESKGLPASSCPVLLNRLTKWIESGIILIEQV